MPNPNLKGQDVLPSGHPACKQKEKKNHCLTKMDHTDIIQSVVLFILIFGFLSVFSVSTVWTCLLTRASNSWKRSCSLPSRKRKDLAKNRGRSPLMFLLLPHRCLFSQVKQTKKKKKLHKITTNVYKLFCHFKPNLNLQHHFCRNPVP